MPAELTTDIMKDIKEIFPKNPTEYSQLVPSKIQISSENSQIFIRDKNLKPIAGYYPYGKGIVVVLGHDGLLQRNTQLFKNIVSFLSK